MSAAAQDGAQHAHDDCAANSTSCGAFAGPGHTLGVGLALGQVLLVNAYARAGVDHGAIVRATLGSSAAG